jgi:shikimate kinase
LLDERRPFYSQAHVKVMSDEAPHADTAQAILKGIDQWLG